MKKIVIAILLIVPIFCMAASATVVVGDECGENVVWEYDTDGILTINGKGRMYDYSDGIYRAERPWEEYEISELVVSEGITHIGEYAFGDFDISCVYLPESLESIGKYAFENTGELHTCADLYDKDSNEKIPDRETFVIPEKVTSIGEGAFYASDVKQVVLPKNLKIIEYSLFRECEKLEKIEIPNGVETVGSYSFACCNELELVVLPVSIKTIGSGAFDDWEDIEGDWGNDYKVTIGYMGTKDEWDKIEKDENNKNLESARIITSYEPGDEDKKVSGVVLLVLIAVVAVVVLIVSRHNKKKKA